MSAHPVEYTFDKSTKTPTARGPFVTRVAKIGVVYEPRNPGKSLSGVRVEDVIDDMILVMNVTGQYKDKRRLLEFKTFFDEYGEVLESRPAMGGNPDLAVGAGHPKNRAILSQMLEEAKRTNELLSKLLEVWGHGGTKA